MSARTVRVKGVEFRVTTAHAASSYGQPVVVCPDGQRLRAWDFFDTGHGVVSGAQVMAAADDDYGDEIPPGDERDG